jgi:hypothetical protein
MKPESKWRTTTRLPPSACPGCGRVHDAATGTVNRAPRDGSISVCIACGAVAIFEAGRLRAPTPAEAAEVANDPRVLMMQRGVRENWQ